MGVCIRRWSRAAKASRVRRVFESRVLVAPYLLNITVCSMVAWLLELMLSELASVDINPSDAAQQDKSFSRGLSRISSHFPTPPTSLPKVLSSPHFMLDPFILPPSDRGQGSIVSKEVRETSPFSSFNQAACSPRHDSTSALFSRQSLTVALVTANVCVIILCQFQ
jgi:hypothetical protein